MAPEVQLLSMEAGSLNRRWWWRIQNGSTSNLGSAEKFATLFLFNLGVRGRLQSLQLCKAGVRGPEAGPRLYLQAGPSSL